MAGMDLSPRRADRGISVFWMILAMGAGVFGLLAILLVTTGQAVEPVPHNDAPEITVNEGETQVNGVGNTEAAANSNDPTFTGDAQTVGGPAPEGDVPSEDVNVPVTPGEPAAAQPDAAAGQDQAETTGEPVVPGQGEVVVDPDGTTAPVIPTPVGPEGRDDETIAD